MGYDKELYRKILELGWLGLTAAERHGGAELDHLHLVLLLEEMGRALLPSPFLPSYLTIEALQSSRHEAHAARWVPEIVSGETVATFAWGEPDGAWGPQHIAARAEPKDGAWVLEGTKAHVLYAKAASLAVVPCLDHKHQVGLFIVDLPSAGVELEDEVCVDPTRPTARLVLDRCRVPHDRRLQGDGAEIFRHVCNVGALAFAAEMTGAAEAVLGLTNEYAKDRKQFNKQIGAFQAVKHPIVNMLVGIEQTRSLVLAGATALSAQARGADKGPAELSARMAKAHASDMLTFAVKKGVQLHGGFGFTWECDVQLYFKRLLYARSTFGDAEHHRAALAASLFE